MRIGAVSHENLGSNPRANAVVNPARLNLLREAALGEVGGISRRPQIVRARFPFDALAALTRSGQALVPLVKARDFGMTPSDAFIGARKLDHFAAGPTRW